MRTLFLTLITCLFVLPAHAKYSGGTGEPNDPYQIATAADLIALGDDPNDYDKHFIMTADIDLDPNLPDRKVFDKAVIAPDTDPATIWFQGTPFTGAFDGNGHVISHMTITGDSYLGLFGLLESCAEVKDLGVVEVNITGSSRDVGGLVGANGVYYYEVGGKVTSCYTTGVISGGGSVGGLVGENWGGTVTQCYSSAAVDGKSNAVGGLVGDNFEGTVTQCYSTGAVSGNSYVGGLVGRGDPLDVICSVWDIETSDQLGSAAGVGLKTGEMMDPYMLGLNGFANDPNWVLDPRRDYPRLAWEGTPGGIIPEPDIHWVEGQGIPESPYRIGTADQLILSSKASILWDKHFVLIADIDLDPNLPGRCVFGQAVFPVFRGVFDGNDHVISNAVIKGTSYLGLFGYIESGAEVRNLGTVDVNIVGSGYCVGGLVGQNSGNVTACYSTGVVSATAQYAPVGGLVGRNVGNVAVCYSTGSVSATAQNTYVGGLVGSNSSTVACCYSTCAVSGVYDAGGLVGQNAGNVNVSYSTGTVIGTGRVGGLVGSYYFLGTVTQCFWDTQTSGQAESAGGTGKTTAEMKDIRTYRGTGWDFRGESEDGLHEGWQMPEDGGYPVLSIFHGYTPPHLEGLGTREAPYLISDALELGAILYYSPYAHYRLAASIDLSGIRWGTAVVPSFAGTFDGNDLTISHLSIDGEYYLGLFGRLTSSAEVRDLGIVDVNITGRDIVGGLAGYNRDGSITKCYISGTISASGSSDGWWLSGGVGGLVGENWGTVTDCYVNGSVTIIGEDKFAGGLIGDNGGRVTRCFSAGSVSGNYSVGGLVGTNPGEVTDCYSTTTVNGDSSVNGDSVVGGLVGQNYKWGRGGLEPAVGFIARCYSSGSVNGDEFAGGLVGWNAGRYREGVVSHSLWDIQTSGQTTSAGGTGKTTAEMQTASTFLEAGWDFVGETANGTEDVWWILEGKDYPRLWWETAGQ